MIVSFDIFSVDEFFLAEAARCVAAAVSPGDIVSLKGDLGSGKTCFARYVIRNLCGDNTRVDSPTFGIVNPYKAQFDIYHFDLYRLRSIEEVWELGLYELICDSVSFIEWPELLGESVSFAISFEFSHSVIENCRDIHVLFDGDNKPELLKFFSAFIHK